MGTSSENAGLLEPPEMVLWVDEEEGGECGCAEPFPDSAQSRRIKECRPALHPSLDQPLLSSCFHNHSPKERSGEDLSPLLHANAELEAEQSSLLLRNSELLSQTLLLRLENQRLREQLDLQLQKRHSAASSSTSLSSLEESSSDSDNEEFLAHGLETSLSKVKLAHTSDDSYSSS